MEQIKRREVQTKGDKQIIFSFNNMFFESTQKFKFQQIKLTDFRKTKKLQSSIKKKDKLFNIKDRQEKNLIYHLEKIKLRQDLPVAKEVEQPNLSEHGSKSLKVIDLKEAYGNVIKRSFGNNEISKGCSDNNIKNTQLKIMNLQLKKMDDDNEKKKVKSVERIKILRNKQKIFNYNTTNFQFKKHQVETKHDNILEQQFRETKIQPIEIKEFLDMPLIEKNDRYERNQKKQKNDRYQKTPSPKLKKQSPNYLSYNQLNNIKNFKNEQFIKILSYKPKYQQRKHISYSKSTRIVSAPNHIKSISNVETTTNPTTTVATVNQITTSLNECETKKKIITKMVFRLNDFNADKIYKKKIETYLDFLYKINFSNNIYIDLNIRPQSQHFVKYKVYIGRGNNSQLLKGLFKRRFWFQIVNSQTQQINFYWTQLKLKEIHQKQIEYKSKENINIDNKVKVAKNLKKLKNLQNLKIMNKTDAMFVQKYLVNCSIRNSIYQKYIPNIVTNHIPQNSFIGSKKALFHSLHYYYKNCLGLDPFWYIPLTFHVKGPDDSSFKEFCKISKGENDKIWILKPGENSNRGTGICLVYAHQIYSKINRKQFHANGELKTYIIQSYINKPFLYHSRKFDIRHYMMITSVRGIMKGFWYQEGYIRTSSQIYDLEELDDNLIHLTNDAIQKFGQNYGKYEPGNKVSYNQFQRYLDTTYPAKKYNFESEIIPKMKALALDAIRANFKNMDKKRKENNFQVFGLDFMIDNKFKPWLIEINSNPCLQISCPLLSRIIPGMIQNALRIGLDPLFPPSIHFPIINRYELSDNILSNLKFELFFDQKTQRQELLQKFQNTKFPEPQFCQVSDHEDEYDDEGQEVQIKI